MQFFLYEIVARIVAIYLCVTTSRALWYGFVERKIAYYTGGDFLGGLLIDWSKWIIHRDTAPVRYWITVGLNIFALVACIFVAIFGWWQPTT